MPIKGVRGKAREVATIEPSPRQIQGQDESLNLGTIESCKTKWGFTPIAVGSMRMILLLEIFIITMGVVFGAFQKQMAVSTL
jgi:hypothetical protein